MKVPSKETFKLVVHCGACMQNRREMLSGILCCRRAGADTLGIFECVLEPLPSALAAYREKKV